MIQDKVWPGGFYVDYSQLNAAITAIPLADREIATSPFADGVQISNPEGALSAGGEFRASNLLYTYVGVRQFNPVGTRGNQGFNRFEWASVLSCSSDLPEVFCMNLSIPNPLSTGARDDNVVQFYSRSPIGGALQDNGRVYGSLRRFNPALNG